MTSPESNWMMAVVAARNFDLDSVAQAVCSIEGRRIAPLVGSWVDCQTQEYIQIESMRTLKAKSVVRIGIPWWDLSLDLGTDHEPDLS
jgi:hypothetical protein